MNLTPFSGPICLAGPTGTGKTAFALEIAQVLPVEIISVDSALVYRGMDIGTAKPSAAEQAAVPHHLIDLIDPLDAYSAGQFVTAAKRIAAEVLTRGRLPLLVGGTMLYFNALHSGLSAMPLADAGLRTELDARAALLGWPAMHAELARLDPVTAARLAPNDSQRIQRALEVCQLAGRPMSELHEQRSGAVGWPMISLEPGNRAWLHQRLAQRFDQMLKLGLLDEVRALRARGDLHAELPSMRCVGYRQAWEALETNDFKDLAERGTIATRQLAKRQLTWLRASPQRHVIACDDPQAKLHLLACLQRLLASNHVGT
ncbi:tRNA (adenosine(37)-N6)-dimethylallyltransferase MiaA [Paucibacter sp. B2R-40]|uniref:tRNA (adenosine(37)-N6)-dimethylallyltransferase MiaA n=1 Tax=Paucibacter sp. B2R-40 TaxID=2893554 RepID=UPI0021E4727C|nr:tRNA (adenosine(37)-N6)-dimethylallyltransferase MiaA [Paucibacter sp. B2R-40]MCV2355854.1 tRNA (adenosine(37)-N6)-dimethylallyltransferase MiaA [Paucibacter sp. B2R-40]